MQMRRGGEGKECRIDNYACQETAPPEDLILAGWARPHICRGQHLLGSGGGMRRLTFMISVLLAYMSRRAFFLASRLESPASSCPKSLTTLPIGAAGAAWLALCVFECGI